MPENLWEALLKTSSFLHFLAHHNEANALTLLSRFCRINNIKDIETLEKFVNDVELRS